MLDLAPSAKAQAAQARVLLLPPQLPRTHSVGAHAAAAQPPNLGGLDIVWRTHGGEQARLQLPQVHRQASAPPAARTQRSLTASSPQPPARQEVEVELLCPPRAQLRRPLLVRCLVHNRGARALALALECRKERAEALFATAKTRQARTPAARLCAATHTCRTLVAHSPHACRTRTAHRCCCADPRRGARALDGGARAAAAARAGGPAHAAWRGGGGSAHAEAVPGPAPTFYSRGGGRGAGGGSAWGRQPRGGVRGAGGRWGAGGGVNRATVCSAGQHTALQDCTAMKFMPYVCCPACARRLSPAGAGAARWLTWPRHR